MSIIKTYRYLFLRSLAAGMTGVLLLVMLVSCSQQKTRGFAGSLEGVDGKQAVALSVDYIDSIALHSPEILASEIRSIAAALDSRGDRQAAMQVAAYPYGIDPEQNPQIAARLLVSTLLIGEPAPPLTANDGSAIHPGSDGRQTILFFYESRCRSCQRMTDAMIEGYGKLQQAEVRVITVCSDTDRELFTEYSHKFPWADKLCDLGGFDSPAFVSYGVAGTPATFMIDKKGIVAEQYGSVDELLEAIEDKPHKIK